MDIKVIIISQEELAQGFVAAVEQLRGPQAAICSLGCNKNSDMESIKTQLEQYLQDNQSAFTVVMTDCFDSEAGNIALETVQQFDQAAVVTGLNLTLLLQALDYNDEFDDQQFINLLVTAGRKEIRAFSGGVTLKPLL